METAIKKKQPCKTISQLPFNEEAGPLMIWNGTRSPEEVKLMSDWVSKRNKEISSEKR